MNQPYRIALGYPVFDPEPQMMPITSGSPSATSRSDCRATSAWNEPSTRAAARFGISRSVIANTGWARLVLSWSPTEWRKAEAVRDKVMRGAGTKEPFILEEARGPPIGASRLAWRRSIAWPRRQT